MILLSELCVMIIDLIDFVTAENGKKQTSKYQKETDKKALRKNNDSMLDKIASEIDSLVTYDTDISIQMENFVQQSFEIHMGDTDISIQMENFVQQSFEIHMGKKNEEKQKHSVSSKGEKTIIFPCSDLNEYKKIIADRKTFKEAVLKNLCPAHQTGSDRIRQGTKILVGEKNLTLLQVIGLKNAKRK